ncbi:MAG: hypothetical protein L6R35_003085 [Caloplaca aegaea]|nr:MAG: hypothetical protein L6R35_003085 [Caloplaca aegaea]
MSAGHHLGVIRHVMLADSKKKNRFKLVPGTRTLLHLPVPTLFRLRKISPQNDWGDLSAYGNGLSSRLSLVTMTAALRSTGPDPSASLVTRPCPANGRRMLMQR